MLSIAHSHLPLYLVLTVSLRNCPGKDSLFMFKRKILRLGVKNLCKLIS